MIKTMILSRARIKRLMKDSNIRSLTELAQKAKIHRNSLGSDIPAFNPVYLSVCKALGVEPDKALESNQTIIRDTVNQIAPNRGFFLYGSRAKGTSREFSDYDIGVTGGEDKLDWREFLKIKQRLEEACENLPVKVSILNFDDAPDNFISDFDSPIEFLGGNHEAFTYFKGHLNGRKKAA